MKRLLGAVGLIVALQCVAATRSCLADELPLGIPGAGQGAESLRLRITNRAGGPVEASEDHGQTWVLLGHVTVPATAVNSAGFTASAWAADSAIAATSVNAIHIRVAQRGETGRGVIFSVVPRGTIVGAALRKPSAAIGTDISGGEAIFGGGLGPYVNSPVYLRTPGGLEPLPRAYVPRENDALVVIRSDLLRMPQYLVFENRSGGAVSLVFADGREVRLGRVDRPVRGVGRFEGAVYAASGRIRANHPGVIDVSTSPLGMIGGFQIIPRKHALSPEMRSSVPAGQWLVVGPDDPDEPDWAGLPPCFSGLIVPSYRSDDITGPYPDWMARALSRAQAQARCGPGPWVPMPRIAFAPRGAEDTGMRTCYGRTGLWLIPAEANPGRPMSAAEKLEAGTALADVTAIRVVLPSAHFPLDDFRQSGPADSAKAREGATAAGE
jgi:hypothetical protein